MFPAEILDRIFSSLQKDRAALCSCSAAHPFLSSIAERHLFVHLLIYIGNPTSATNGFLVPQLSRCLSERPYLADHVRSITIDSRVYSGPCEAFEELSNLLPLISRSETVSLLNIKWLGLPEKLRSAFLNYLRMPRMKEIYLQNCTHFPLTTLDDATNIKSLKFDSWRCSYKALNDTANPIPTSLESLFLVDVDSQEFISWVLPRVVRLISLHAKASLFALPNLTPIFYACFESLRSLTLEIGTSCMFLTRIDCPADTYIPSPNCIHR
jgi:hypothetical protein